MTKYKIGQIIKIHRMNYFGKYAVITNIRIDCNEMMVLSISVDGKEKELKIYPEIDDIEIVKDYFSKEFLSREVDEFNSMTPKDAIEEINSWDFEEVFGSDAERLSDAIKRLALLVEEVSE